MDKQELERLYWEEGMSQKDIGDKVGVSQVTIGNWMRKYGIEARKPNHQKYGSHQIDDGRGYERFKVQEGGKTKGIRIHRLAAIAWHGFDAVQGMHVHHKNGRKFDNREENLEVLSPSEHAALHNRQS